MRPRWQDCCSPRKLWFQKFRKRRKSQPCLLAAATCIKHKSDFLEATSLASWSPFLLPKENEETSVRLNSPSPVEPRSKLAETALQAARAAGRILMKYFLEKAEK